MFGFGKKRENMTTKYKNLISMIMSIDSGYEIAESSDISVTINKGFKNGDYLEFYLWEGLEKMSITWQFSEANTGKLNHLRWEFNKNSDQKNMFLRVMTDLKKEAEKFMSEQ